MRNSIAPPPPVVNITATARTLQVTVLFTARLAVQEEIEVFLEFSGIFAHCREDFLLERSKRRAVLKVQR